MRKEYFIIAFILLIGAIVFFVVSSVRDTPASSPSDELAECENLIYNGEDKINILFFSDEETSREYSKFFLETEPFIQNKGEFNFYYIDIQPDCELYKDIALFCYSEDLIKLAALCPNDYIVVLQNQMSKIRSSAYMNTMSLNSRHPKSVFLHEFGHVFANLAEEYITEQNLPKGSKNCVSDCKDFEELENGCYEGCTKESLIRSIKNGVMRTLSSKTYGGFNEKLIQDRINQRFSSITGEAIQEIRDCSSERYYLISGRYSGGQMEIIKKTIESGCVGGNGVGDFVYKIVLDDDSILSGGEFNPEFIFTDVQDEEEDLLIGDTYISDKPFVLKLPLLDRAKIVEISKDGEVIPQINLKDIGNRICKK